MPGASLTGHRQRLRDRFLAGESASHTDEALLELLLFYAIPQKDVRPLATDLLTKFGSLGNVLSARPDALCQVDGLKENTATLLKVVDRIRSNREPATASSSPEPAAGVGQLALFEVGVDVTADVEEPDLLDFAVDQLESAPEVTQAETMEERPMPPRRVTGIITNSVLRESIALLPTLPDTESLDEIRGYLRGNLHFSGEQTRERFASYIARRMFPSGWADSSLRLFAKRLAGTQALRDVCFYRFMVAEPLMVRVMNGLLYPNIGVGRLERAGLREDLAQWFPTSKSVSACAQAICETLSSADIAKIGRTQLTFGFRDFSIQSFAFILHSEFPEPGMYDIAKLEENQYVRALLWNPERILPSLYELRNLGIISKVSEIDSFRQFTTRWDLERVVAEITGSREST